VAACLPRLTGLTPKLHSFVFTNERAMGQVLRLIDGRHSKDAAVRGEAETGLQQLNALQNALRAVLDEPEAFSWEGASVKGRDILDMLGRE
jgi:hypothetical protein